MVVSSILIVRKPKHKVAAAGIAKPVFTKIMIDSKAAMPIIIKSFRLQSHRFAVALRF